MVTLRLKFILALLVTSLAAVVMVGLVTRWMLLREFSGILLDESFRAFKSDVVAYIQTYGSYEKAAKTEPFGQFQRKRQAMMAPPGQPPGGGSGGLWPPTGARDGRISRQPPGLREGARPSIPPQPGGIAMGAPAGPQGPGPVQGQPGPPQGIRDLPGRGPNGPPPEMSQAGTPPFKFMLLDARGRVLLGDDNLRGDPAPPGVLEMGTPVRIKGKLVAYAIPDPNPNLNDLDMGYLRAAEKALEVSAGFAVLVSIALGIFFGDRLSSGLRDLHRAINRMEGGELRQQLTPKSNDEVGALVVAFNEMSASLAEAHEELKTSSAKIQEQAAKLKELSVRDELTGLHNRRHFNENATLLLSQARRYDQPFSVMIGDIDFFKRINDNFSHAIGDEVLRHVARLLREGTRASDIVARYGGEEFVIAFPQTPVESAAQYCDRLRAVIEKHDWPSIHPDLRVTMSMGLDGDTSRSYLEDLVAAADARLYVAKSEGRNRVMAG